MWFNASAAPQKKTSCLVIVTVIVAMKVLGVSVTLCAILSLGRSQEFNVTIQTGGCRTESQNCSGSYGANCPQCDPDGNYLPQQCLYSSGYCWCVNITSGKEIPNTRAGPGHSPGCGLCKKQQQNCSINLPGSFCPQCDRNGNFLPEQCSGSTGFCWCVDIITGNTLPNSTTPPGVQSDCGLCKKEQQNCSINLPGSFCVQCDRNGNFLPKQCSGSTGYCWCVDIFSGKEIPNTSRPPGPPPVCGQDAGSEEDTGTQPGGPGPVCPNCVTGLCKKQQQNCSIHIPGSFCPQCDSHGNFLPKQCSGSTGFCWCVDIFSGNTLPNSTTPPGVQSDCGQDTGTQPGGPGPVCPNCDQDVSSEEDTETLPEGPDEDSHECPRGWVKSGNWCFIFIDTPKTWVNAEVYCQFEKANLASVHCEKENRFIMSLTRGSSHNFPQTWLGGFDAIHPGYWMWSDGSQFNYENWYENDRDDDEHDHHDKHGKNCLSINYEYDLKWFQASCTDTLPFVCAKRVQIKP